MRLLTADNETSWLVEAHGQELTWTTLSGDDPTPATEVFRLSLSARSQATVLDASLAELGDVARLRNPSLWDALATAIVRQVIRAGQARKLYREFCDRFGPTVARSDETDIRAFPSPEHALTLSDGDFTESGMAFKRRPLRHAAEAFMARAEQWTGLAPSVLVKELQTIPGVGPWSAGAAVADWSNDWTLYPYGDLAVRTWARHADPGTAWPADDSTFAAHWRRVTGDQLGAYTLLTLAFGCRQVGAV
ncbi:hypothetical protein O7602_23355 [Micromonospora sp. WMMD1128]|uniref:hypothetical protein n=1 Tax=Micromonospora sp. WMMD1128 TaxID=3015150 RepID=UPI00248C5AB0|nr:hypothetical protein [Micromonospora sp. WMMD1128]WBB72615.1 hypothetical protein O7602_23355 [Micromonospora sp. WMMD1128]